MSERRDLLSDRKFLQDNIRVGDSLDDQILDIVFHSLERAIEAEALIPKLQTLIEEACHRIVALSELLSEKAEKSDGVLPGDAQAQPPGADGCAAVRQPPHAGPAPPAAPSPGSVGA